MKIISVVVAFLLLAGWCDKSVQSFSQRTISRPELSVSAVPLLIEQEQNDLINLRFSLTGPDEDLAVEKIVIVFTDDSDVASLASVSAWYMDLASDTLKRVLFAASAKPARKTRLTGRVHISSGRNECVIGLKARPDADLMSIIGIKSVNILFSDHSIKKITVRGTDTRIRFGRVLRQAGQDGCNTYRIPGLITTNAGTLIAVYDNRYNSSKDLQEDIDIGMSRSTDRGQTWEPMKVLMDMGEYGGRSEQLNGTGDPCVLYDPNTNTIWVAALWMSGSAPDKMLWWDSQPGMTPEETGQFMLVKSTDDGVTWSEPLNITRQIKNPEWQLLLQGPGRGITLDDGTLVFPAQYKEDIGLKALDGGQYTCHSTIIWSSDGGNNWHIGTGAKSNTTEAQVVQLSDGSLMLNMRDDRNRTDKSVSNGRAVAVTTDLGRTWTVHPSSNSALPEPNCMASLISAELNIGGAQKKVLFFSNPNDKSDRIRMTIKTSFDEGFTWPEINWLELYGPSCYGYSCMTMIDNKTIGIVYEGTKDLIFQKIPVSVLIKGRP